MTRWGVFISCCLATGLSPPLSAGEKANRLRVPAGFVIDKVAGEPDVVFPMFAVFDDRGRLFVTESSGLDLYAELQALTRKCRIRLLEDPDAKGRFRKSRVFADKLVFPMGLAWRDGKLYVADPPDLVVLEDTRGTGRADKRTVLLSGFGHKDNGSLHGLTFGPDGLLYMTLGHPDGYKFKDRRGKTVQGESGALVRCRPDGSDPEVLCRGFENLVEIAFTPRGEVVGTDNWFQRPEGGKRDALVHLVEGGLYPLHRDVGTPLPVTGEPLPPISLYPAVALSGLTRYRGPLFPGPVQGNLFSAQHNARRVMRHVLVPSGCTFRTEDHEFVTTDDPDFHPSDVLEAPDGSLLVVDTGSWYVHHCPTGKIRKVRAAGGIYRVRPAKAAPVEDPLGRKVNWQDASVKRLTELLGDRRPFVRDRARQVLASRGKRSVAGLAGLLDGSAAVAVKQRALWALTANPDASALAPLRKALKHADPDVIATAARGLAVRRDRLVAADLGRLLAARSPQVRLAAAEALARCGDAGSLPALWQALSQEPDRFLEHALVHAVHWLADAKALQAALTNRSPRVQRAALRLLDQPPRPKGALGPGAVVQRVTAADADLRQTALHLLESHPEWAKHALGLLRGWLAKEKLSEEERGGLRGLILAFQRQAAVQAVVGEALARSADRKAAGRQVFLLETLAECSLAELPASWLEALASALKDRRPAVRLQAVRTVAVLQLARFDPALAELAKNKAEAAELRLEALRALTARRPRLSAAWFQFLLDRLAEKDKPLSRLAAAEVVGRAHLSDAQVLRLLRAVQGDGLISPAVLLPALERSLNGTTAPRLLAYLQEGLRHGWRPAAKDLERVLKAVPAAFKNRADRVRQQWRKSLEGERARLREFEALLRGGKTEKGRAVFFGTKVACATCHRVGREGGQVGPDLTRVGAIRSGRDILESILFPSSTIAQGYETYYVTTKDGRVASGVIARQSAEVVVLRNAGGAELRVRKDRIRDMQRLPTSIMPEGLARAMTRDEFRDLLAFLQSLK
jgi:putative membrane-bound dehydrogenase-like protein